MECFGSASSLGPTGSTTSMVLAHRRRHLFLGEPYAQLRKVGRPIYISHPDLVQSPTMRGTDPPTISQSASKPDHLPQQTCSLTGSRSAP